MNLDPNSARALGCGVHSHDTASCAGAKTTGPDRTACAPSPWSSPRPRTTDVVDLTPTDTRSCRARATTFMEAPKIKLAIRPDTVGRLACAPARAPGCLV